jgi:Tol biopolymer transport system component/DNA-binding winged helix-turn-helix (wHTH) protein
VIGHNPLVFKFDDVEVREREFTLFRAGEALPVEPKAFRVLLLLLRNAGKLITKEELLNAVWGDAAVTDNSVARSVALLRRLLGDETRNPRYIETIATVGYRFICPVEVLKGADVGLALAASAGKPDAPPETNKGNSVDAAAASVRGGVGTSLMRPWLWTTLAAVVALFAIAIWYLRRPLPPPRVTQYAQITHDARHKMPLATDGARVYLYLNLQPDHWAQVPVSGGEVTPFPLPFPNALLLDVSPDGSSLLVASFDSGRQTLWSVQIQGGSLRRLLDDSRVISAKWSPDGKLLACYNTNGDIDVMQSDGSGSHKLLSFPGHLGTFPSGEISWSPDGSRIRFTRDYKIWEMSSNGSGLHPLLPDWHASEWQGYGHWTPDGKFFVFISRVPPIMINTPPSAQIWALDERHSFLRPAPTEPVQLTSGPIHWGAPIPGRDGKTIFSRGVTLRGELDRFDAQSRQLEPYLSGISAEWVDFSPDGKSVVYVTFPEGILWRANRDGSNPTQLTDPPLYPIAPHWSPDGREILFSAHDSEGRVKIYLLPSEGGKPQMLLPSDQQEERNPNWSPDGRKIVFDTGQIPDSSKRVIHILDLSSGQITDIPGSQGRWSPRWSPDGRYIAALTAGASLAVFDFKTQQWSPVIQEGEVSIHTWSHDGKFIYFLRGVDHPGVYRMRPSGGEAEQVVDLQGFRFTGVAVYFMGLDPEDTPLLLRDTGVDDIFALTLEAR